MRAEAVEEAPRAFAILRMELQPGIDERPDQPSPYRPLMVGRVAGAEIAEVSRLEVRMARRERAQAEGCQQLALHGVDDRRPAARLEHRVRQRDGEDLVGTA